MQFRCPLRKSRGFGFNGLQRLSVLTWRGMVFVVLESVEILVALATCVASVRFVLLHPQGSWVNMMSIRVDDGERAIVIGVQLLRIMTMLQGY